MVRDSDEDGLSMASGAAPSRTVSVLSAKQKTATFIVTGVASSKPKPTRQEAAQALLEGPGIPEYIDECNRTGAIPVSYFLRHVRDDTFIMRYRGLGPLGAKALARPLESNTHILTLDLEGNSIGSRGALYLASSLRDNVSLTKLCVAGNNIRTTGACAIIEMMRENKILTDLDISANGLSDVDGRIFYILLKHNHNMKHLALRHNCLAENSVDWLQEAFEHNDTLTVLDLGWNHIRQRAAITIGNILAENSSLLELHMTMNGLGLEGAWAIAEALVKNSTLEVLDISANRILTDGAFEIAKSLEVNQTLKTLKIGDNPIIPEGALALITAIDKNKESAVKLLHMKAVMVTDEFELLQTKLGNERKLKVVHGGILGGRRMLKARHIQKKRAALESLELKYRKDPMTKLRDYCEQRQVRLVDVFRQFDRDQSWTLTRDEIVSGVENAGIDMNDKDIDTLLKMLDADENGSLDYQELVYGDAENKKEKMRIAKWNQEMKEQEREFEDELRLLKNRNKRV